jgi:ribosomal protein S18 acetylase RimI-like enzyme
MTTVVRRARAGEIGPAVAVWRAANPDTTIPDHADWLRAQAGDPDVLLLVAEGGGHIVGMVLVLPGRAHDGGGDPIPGHVHLTGLAVSPDNQRGGTGSALLDAALREAAKRSSTHVTLWAAEGNLSARRLFASRGFTPTGRSATDADGTQMLHFEHRMPPTTGSEPAKRGDDAGGATTIPRSW